MGRQTFALFFGNRGFFPESLIAGAREEMAAALEKNGYGHIVLDASATRYGAVESAAEGEIYAKFLEENKGRFDGVIVCLPNFGDETGAVTALRDCGVPILVQAYPDELDKMDNARRRDAFCGKFSVMDVFYQYGLKFTNLVPHVVHPSSAEFAENLNEFAAVCRVVKRMKRLTMGAIGARTSAFKTVRFDELALQKYGITTETMDLLEIAHRMDSLDAASQIVKDKLAHLAEYADCSKAPVSSLENLAKLSVVLDEVVDELKLDAISIRCWMELEKVFKIAPCILLSDLNNRGIPAACELDVGNGIMMAALAAASGGAATCLDWNNNYGGDPDKCILFHCGPVPSSLMKSKGELVEHYMFAKSLGCGCGWGPNQGRIASFPMTFASAKTENGKIFAYLGEGEITDDEIPREYFGCAGVAKIGNLQKKLQTIGANGFRHHVSLAKGRYESALREAFGKYLGYELADIGG